MTPEDRGGVRIGVLVPFTNTNLEPDLMMMRPRGSTLHFHRLGNYDADKIPAAEQMAGLGASDISEDLRLICGVRPDAVLYGCTSATLTHGADFDKDLAVRINTYSNALSLTAAGCLIEALNALAVSRVGFACPMLARLTNLRSAFSKANRSQRLTVPISVGNWATTAKESSVRMKSLSSRVVPITLTHKPWS